MNLNVTDDSYLLDMVASILNALTITSYTLVGKLFVIFMYISVKRFPFILITTEWRSTNMDAEFIATDRKYVPTY